jgi:hypothetical protein
MMRGRTRLNAHRARRQSRKELQYFRPVYSLPDHYCAFHVHPVNLEDRLRNIETNSANLAYGRLPSLLVRFSATTLWHFDAAEWAPSTASFSTNRRNERHVGFARDNRHPSGRPKSTLSANRRHRPVSFDHLVSGGDQHGRVFGRFLFGLRRAFTFCAFGLGALGLNRSVAFGLLRPFGLTGFLFRPFRSRG